MSEFSLQRSGQLPLRFNGELLAVADSKRPDGVRWSELGIYRLDDGRYVVHSVGRTKHPNERDRFAATICDGATAVLRALVRDNGRYTDLALRALSDAANKDRALADASAEDLT
jgi:hypothetical protein